MSASCVRSCVLESHTAQEPPVQHATEPEICNGLTVNSLLDSVSHLAMGEKDLLEVLRLLARKVFTESEPREHEFSHRQKDMPV